MDPRAHEATVFEDSLAKLLACGISWGLTRDKAPCFKTPQQTVRRATFVLCLWLQDLHLHTLVGHVSFCEPQPGTNACAEDETKDFEGPFGAEGVLNPQP